MIFAVPSGLLGRSTGMDIEIFGLASTSGSDNMRKNVRYCVLYVLYCITYQYGPYYLPDNTVTAHTCIIHTNVTETCVRGSRAPRRDETRCAGAVRSRWFARSHRFRVRVTWLMAGPRRTRAAASSPANLNPYASSESV